MSEPVLFAPPSPAPDRSSRRRSGWRSLFDWALVIGGALLVALVVRTFVAQAFFIPTSSMEPTLVGELRDDRSTGVGDRVIVNKLSYRLHEVRRGDVIVFERPEEGELTPSPSAKPSASPTTSAAPRAEHAGEEAVEDLIKRVVAVAGETVVISEGRVFVNGKPLAEPYLPAGVTTKAGPGAILWPHRCTTDDPCTIPAGSVWVMGDNRANSYDSRFLGPINENLIIGRAVTIMWPLSRAGGL